LSAPTRAWFRTVPRAMDGSGRAAALVPVAERQLRQAPVAAVRAHRKNRSR